MPGSLYLVALPIGNMEDITLRAIKTLRAVDLIVAEDTRNTSRILDRYRIKTRFHRSYYQGVEKERVAPLLGLLAEGKEIALVSDAGTPLINDPGYPLVRAVIAAGIAVVPIPGPTAVITALVASGLPADRFIFSGAVPRKDGERRALLEKIRVEEQTVILYESPHRLIATLEALAEILPERTIVLARELTKVHEEFLRGTPPEILTTMKERDRVRGECVLLIARGEEIGLSWDRTSAIRLAELLKEEGVANRAAVKIMVQALGIPRNEAYRLINPSF